MKSKMIGKKVYITDKESPHCDEWGAICGVADGVYCVRIAEGEEGAGQVVLFKRSQFWIPVVRGGRK